MGEAPKTCVGAADGASARVYFFSSFSHRMSCMSELPVTVRRQMVIPNATEGFNSVLPTRKLRNFKPEVQSNPQPHPGFPPLGPWSSGG